MLPLWQKVLLLVSLYLSQGLPYGFLTQAVPALMRIEGASLATIGDTSLLFAPWLLKVCWAPFVDRFWWSWLGRRRSWIIPLQILSIIVICSLATRTPEHMVQVLLGFMLISSFISATQDIATDGLAVSLLKSNERGWGNGIQVAGYRLGMTLGGSALLIVFAQLSWTWSFYLMAIFMMAASIPVLLIREPQESLETSDTQGFFPFIRQPGIWLWLLLLVAFKLGEQMGGSVTRPMLIDLGLSLEEVGWLAGMDSFFSLLGAMAGGILLNTFRQRRTALVAFGVLQSLGIGAWVLPAIVSTSVWVVAVVKLADGFVGSMATVALFTAMMDRCDSRDGGTEYTLQASVVLLASFLGSILGGRMAEAIQSWYGQELGYAVFFGVTAMLTLLGALSIYLDRSPFLRARCP